MPVLRLSPGLRRPTWFTGGHSVWTFTGSDTIVCGRVSLFTKATRLHALMRTSAGKTPAGPMVTVTASEDGADGADPHEIANTETQVRIASRCRT